MYVLVRAIHILFGALWVGIAVCGAWVLTPLSSEFGPDAARISAVFRRRGFIAGMPIIAGLTILSGFWLYWRFAHISAEASRTHAGIAYGTGGLLGIIAFVIGGALIGRNMVKAARLAGQAASSASVDERARLMSQATALRHRADAAGNLVAVLLVITVLLMATALYL
jgi:hypothetical protein